MIAKQITDEQSEFNKKYQYKQTNMEYYFLKER